jgi:hypothetical protein
MYTGQLHTGTIYMGTVVERVGHGRAACGGLNTNDKNKRNCDAIFAMQIPVTASDQVFMGAA